MQCDQKPGFGRGELTFVGILECDFGASHHSRGASLGWANGCRTARVAILWGQSGANKRSPVL